MKNNRKSMKNGSGNASMIRRIALMMAMAVTVFAIGWIGGSNNTGAVAEETATTERETMSVVDTVAQCQNSVVQVTVYAETWDRMSRETSNAVYGYGSGSLIRTDDAGCYILTNYHVVESGDAFKILWFDGTENDCELIGYDSSSDIAILYFEGKQPDGVNVLPIGNSSELKCGEQIIVIGNPVADTDDAYALYDTVTVGHVSGVERDIDTASAYASSNASLQAVKLVQVDASINGGVSGGALINLKGELVGIPTIRYTSADNLGFCIQIDSVKTYIDEIIDHGSVQRPMLGVGVQVYDGPDEPMRNYAPAGVAVLKIYDNSGAADSELELYDIITAVDGVRVTSVDDLQDVVFGKAEGDVVTLTVYRYYDESGEWIGMPDGALEIEVELRVLDTDN